MLWWNLRKLRSVNATPRRKAIAALGRSKSPRALGPLLKIVQEPLSDYATYNAWVVDRRKAVEALGELGDHGAVAILGKALRDRELTEVAVTALSRFGQHSIAVLTASLIDGDLDFPLKRPIADQLTRMGWEPRSALEKAWFFVVSGGYEQAAAIGQPAVDPLFAALRVSFHTPQIPRAILQADKQPSTKKRLADSLIDFVLRFGSHKLYTQENKERQQNIPVVVALLKQMQDPRVSKLCPFMSVQDDGRKATCSECGKALKPLPSIFGSGQVVVLGSSSVEQARDDYAQLAGSVCFPCAKVYCVECLAGGVDSCPNCHGEARPAYKKTLWELVERVRNELWIKEQPATATAARQPAPAAVSDEAESVLGISSGGHYVLKCIDCDFTHYIPGDSTLHLVKYSVDVDEVKMVCVYGGAFTVTLEVKEFFTITNVPESGRVLHASIRDNMNPLHSHMLSHCDPLFLVIQQSANRTTHGYRKRPEGTTYVKFSRGRGVDIVGNINLSKAEIPEVSD